jgi:hypothetical protein
MMRMRSLMIERCIACERLLELELGVGILSMSGLYMENWLGFLLPLC